MKIFLPVLAVFFSFSGLSVNDVGYIISSIAYIYSQPSFSSEKINVDGQPVTLSHGQEVSIGEETGDFVYISVTYEQNEINGYVYKYYLTTSSPQTVYPVFNGSIRRDTNIYDLNYQPAYELKNGKEVYIYSGYESDEGFTAVQVVLDDGSLYSGFVKTEDLEPYGISPLLIVGISIISACVTVILSLVFIKKSKKSKNK